MPKYNAFNKRVCYLADAIKTLANVLLSGLAGAPGCTTHLTDSMPIVLAKQSRSNCAKVAPEMCDKGYCDSKKMWYYGIKLHALGLGRYKAMPEPKQMMITPASVHDRKAAVEMLTDVYGIDLFGDKAFINAQWEANIKSTNQITIYTPIKLQKGQERLDSADSLFSSAVSRVRQPIESFFNWLQETTQIHIASKVRSTNGLIAFVFARIAVACLFLANVIDI